MTGAVISIRTKDKDIINVCLPWVKSFQSLIQEIESIVDTKIVDTKGLLFHLETKGLFISNQNEQETIEFLNEINYKPSRSIHDDYTFEGIIYLGDKNMGVVRGYGPTIDLDFNTGVIDFKEVLDFRETKEEDITQKDLTIDYPSIESITEASEPIIVETPETERTFFKKSDKFSLLKY